MNEETGEKERSDVLNQTGEGVRKVASQEDRTDLFESPNFSSGAGVEIEAVQVFDSDGGIEEFTGRETGQASLLHRYGLWAALSAGAILVAVAALQLRSRSQKQKEVETVRRRYLGVPVQSIDLMQVTQSLRQRVPGIWTRGEVEVIDTPKERRITLHLPWGRSADEAMAEDLSQSKWQTIAARLPRRG